ncbi:MAG: NAD-dependent epimerase/dehydratase family protein [Candidatus Omnitrophica bacterium]|nr:NAD-dependent epimerase/dehydratase family protein [Candidatus Omnitrophota bacterium]
MNLITGGSGFIGINIARSLLEKGKRVKVLDIAPPGMDIVKNKIEHLNIDIRNRREVIEACQGAENIYHTVSLVPISKAGRKFWDVNVEGTRNILEGALKHGVKKIIHMSSSAVCDINQKNPLTEESQIKPLGAYGHSKYAAEKVCHEYRKKGLDITIVRPRTVLGPERLGIFGILYDWIKNGKSIYIIGDGSNKIQFMHIKELAEACILMTQKVSNEVFNIGTDRFSALKDDLGALIDYAGTKSRIVCLNPTLAIGTLRILDKLGLSPLADWHYLSYHKDFYFDITKVKRMLNWQPSYSNKEMLIESYQWYLEHFKEVKIQIGTTHRKSVKQRLLKLLRGVS